VQELFNEVDKDIKIIDKERLEEESLRTPLLHHKYLKMMITFSLEFAKLEEQYNMMIKDKTHFYLGKSDPEVYSETPFDLKVLKGDLKLYIDSDEDLSKLRQRITYTKERVDYLRSVCKIVSDRNWAIKNSMDWLKFKEGIV